MTLFALEDDECHALASGVPTPLFAYVDRIAEGQLVDLRSVLPPRVRIAYAVKANPHPELLALFGRLGTGFDCASVGELRKVEELGVRPRVFFAGPGKGRREVELGLELGVRFQVESLEELLLIDALASHPVSVNLRVHPRSGVVENNPIIGGCGPSAFGFDEEDLAQILERIETLRFVEVAGLHVFAASNECRADALLSTYETALRIAQRLQLRLRRPLEQIDLGGGLGVPYSTDQPPLDLEALGRGIGDLLNRSCWFEGELILEPGRFLAAACGVYLSRVVRVKESRGVRFVVLEGGINHLLRPLLTDQPFPVRACSRKGPVRSAVLAGPLCTSLDRLGEVQLPEVSAGDLLAFGQCGAYGRTEAMSDFLSHPPAEEVWISGTESSAQSSSQTDQPARWSAPSRSAVRDAEPA